LKGLQLMVERSPKSQHEPWRDQVVLLFRRCFSLSDDIETAESEGLTLAVVLPARGWALEVLQPWLAEGYLEIEKLVPP
jgi:hypothetical protein